MNRDREALTRLVAAVERCTTASERRDFVSSIEGRTRRDAREVDKLLKRLSKATGRGSPLGAVVVAETGVRPLVCGCYACTEALVAADGANPLDHRLQRYFLCPTCGNKRCPRSTDHVLACSGTNDPDHPLNKPA